MQMMQLKQFVNGAPCGVAVEALSSSTLEPWDGRRFYLDGASWSNHSEKVGIEPSVYLEHQKKRYEHGITQKKYGGLKKSGIKEKLRQ